MASFMIYYWIQHGDKSHSVCECINADNLEHATTVVQEQLLKPSISFDSIGKGRVILQTPHIQYVEIEDGECAAGDLPEGFNS
jgi:hypothetical protein